MVTPEQAKQAEMLRLTQGQRDAAANAYVEAMGELAAWSARWNDKALLEERLAELSLPASQSESTAQP